MRGDPYLLANDLEHISQENGFSFVSSVEESVWRIVAGSKALTGAEMTLEMLESGEGAAAVLARQRLSMGGRRLLPGAGSSLFVVHGGRGDK